MEKISQTEKHKGGRPRIYPKEYIGSMRKLYSEYTTDRSINNAHYMSSAFDIIYHLPDNNFTYLVDNKNQKLHHTTILTALGRIVEKYSNGEELMLKFAKTICDKKMKTSEAIFYLNNCRMWNENSPKLNKHNITGALKKIVNIINNSNFDEDEMQFFFIALKALAEENLPAEEEDEE